MFDMQGLASLFGPQQPQGGGGLAQMFSDPSRMAALASAAGAMGKLSGPSTTKQGLGAIIGGGMEAYGPAYANAQQSQMQQQLFGLKQAEFAQKQKQQQAMEAEIEKLPEEQRAAARAAPEAFFGALAKRQFAEPKEPKFETIYDQASGRERKVRVYPDGRIEEIGGIKGDTLSPEAVDQQKAIRAAGVNSTTINMPPLEREYDKVTGKQLGEVHVARQQAASKADSTRSNINAMRALADEWRKAGGELGALTPLQANIAGFMQAAGIDPTVLGLPSNAAPVQIIDALSKRFVLENIGGEGGIPANNFSNADREFISQTVALPSDRPEAFEAKLFLADRVAQRAQQAAEFLADARSRRLMSPDQIEAEWQKYIRQNPLFGEAERKQIGAIVNAKQATAKPQSAPAQASNAGGWSIKRLD